MAPLAKEISSLKTTWPHWQRRYLLSRGDIITYKGDIFFEEETDTLAKEISSLKRRYHHWQRRYLL
jgi:hypothetical protein